MSKAKIKNHAVIMLFLLPALSIFAYFILYPVGRTVFLSFREWKGVYGAPMKFVGLNNFRQVLGSDGFWLSMRNSLFFMIGGFVILMPISFALALLVTSKLKGTTVMKTCYFMPIMLSTTAVALMWVYMLNPSYGVIYQVLRAVGLGGLAKEWLATPTVNVWCVVLVNEWMYAGYNMLLFAAGLVAIPSELYEAAEIDGCSGWKKVWYLSIPLSKESFKIFAITCVTGCLKVFDLIWAMTKGGPMHSSETPATLLYNEAFGYKFFGRSSAIGVILLIIGVSCSLVLNKAFQGKEE